MFAAATAVAETTLSALRNEVHVEIVAAAGIQAEAAHHRLPLGAVGPHPDTGIEPENHMVRHFVPRCLPAVSLELSGRHVGIETDAGLGVAAILPGGAATQVETNLQGLEGQLPVVLGFPQPVLHQRHQPPLLLV